MIIQRANYANLPNKKQYSSANKQIAFKQNLRTAGLADLLGDEFTHIYKKAVDVFDKGDNIETLNILPNANSKKRQETVIKLYQAIVTEKIETFRKNPHARLQRIFDLGDKKDFNEIYLSNVAELIGEDFPRIYYKAKDLVNKGRSVEELNILPSANPDQRQYVYMKIYEAIENENKYNFQQKMHTRNQDIIDKLMSLPEYDEHCVEFLDDKKPTELEYLYNIASKTDEQGKLRIPGDYFLRFSKIQYGMLKALEPIMLSQNADGIWKYKPNFILSLVNNFDYNDVDFISKLAENKVDGFNSYTILNNPKLNWKKIFEKAKEINALFGEKLRSIGFWSNNKGHNFIRVEVSEMDATGKESIKEMRSFLDYNVNPVAGEKLSLENKLAIDKLYKTLWQKSCSKHPNELIKIINNLYFLKSQYFERADILRLLQRLTQFAEYSSLEKIANELKKENVIQICPNGGINPIMNYFYKSKNLFELSTNYEDAKIASFVTKEDIDTPEFADFVQNIKDKELTERILFINLDGWSDGLNLFRDNNNLEKLATDVLSRVENYMYVNPEKRCYRTCDEFLNDILNGKVEDKLQKMGVNYKTIRVNAPLTPNTIWEQTLPIMPPKSVLAANIKAVANHFINNENQFDAMCERIAKYYTENLNVFSKQRIIEDMRVLNSKINNYLEENSLSRENLYCILPEVPEHYYKSFQLINKMFTELFDIPQEKNIKIFTMTELNNYPPDSTFVIIDDIAGSGASMIGIGEYVYNANRINPNQHVVFAPLVAAKSGLETIQYAIDRMERNGIDKIINIEENTYDCAQTTENFLNVFEGMSKEVAKNIFGSSGHGGGGLCTVFPYMAPDNNSTLASYIARFFLPSGKCIKNRSNELSEIEKSTYIHDIFGKKPEQGLFTEAGDVQ